MSEVFSGVLVTHCDGSVWCAVIWNQGGLRSGRAGWKHSAPWRDRPCKEQLLLLKQQRGRCGLIYHAARTHLVLTREDAPTGRTCSWSSSRECSLSQKPKLLQLLLLEHLALPWLEAAR